MFRLGFVSFLTVQMLVRESQVVREAKEKQIVELKKLCEQSTDSLNNDWEKRVMSTTCSNENEEENKSIWLIGNTVLIT